MKAFFFLVGAILTVLGARDLVLQSPSVFLSSWGLLFLALGLTSLLSLSNTGMFFSFLGAVIIFVTGIVRIFLGTGDWWLWLLTAFGMVVIMLIQSTRFADEDTSSGNAADNDSPSNLQAQDPHTVATRDYSATGDSSTIPPIQPPTQRSVTRISIPSARQVMAGMSRSQPKRTTSTTVASCGACGAQISTGARFCGSCGSATP